MRILATVALGAALLAAPLRTNQIDAKEKRLPRLPDVPLIDPLQEIGKAFPPPVQQKPISCVFFNGETNKFEVNENLLRKNIEDGKVPEKQAVVMAKVGYLMVGAPKYADMGFDELKKKASAKWNWQDFLVRGSLFRLQAQCDIANNLIKDSKGTNIVVPIKTDENDPFEFSGAKGTTFNFDDSIEGYGIGAPFIFPLNNCHVHRVFLVRRADKENKLYTRVVLRGPRYNRFPNKKKIFDIPPENNVLFVECDKNNKSIKTTYCVNPGD